MQTLLGKDHGENVNPKTKEKLRYRQSWEEQIELITNMTESENKLTAMNKLIDQRDTFVGGFLKNPKTLGIMVYSHKVNTQDHPNFAISRVSVNAKKKLIKVIKPQTKT